MEKVENTTLTSDYITVRKEKVVLFLYVPMLVAHLQPNIFTSVTVDNTIKNYSSRPIRVNSETRIKLYFGQFSPRNNNIIYQCFRHIANNS